MNLFILEKIDSVGHLEVLILLAQDSGQSWTAESLSRELRSNVSLAQNQLEALRRHGLVELNQQGEFVYKPKSPKLADLTDKITDYFRERRMMIINLIYSKPEERLKDFADAFRLKRCQ